MQVEVEVAHIGQDMKPTPQEVVLVLGRVEPLPLMDLMQVLQTVVLVAAVRVEIKRPQLGAMVLLA